MASSTSYVDFDRYDAHRSKEWFDPTKTIEFGQLDTAHHHRFVSQWAFKQSSRSTKCWRYLFLTEQEVVSVIESKRNRTSKQLGLIVVFHIGQSDYCQKLLYFSLPMYILQTSPLIAALIRSEKKIYLPFHSPGSHWRWHSEGIVGHHHILSSLIPCLHPTISASEI